MINLAIPSLKSLIRAVTKI